MASKQEMFRALVRAEMERSVHKHGSRLANLDEACSVLDEEIEEVRREVFRQTPVDLLPELVQVAAVALRWLHDVDHWLLESIEGSVARCSIDLLKDGKPHSNHEALTRLCRPAHHLRREVLEHFRSNPVKLIAIAAQAERFACDMLDMHDLEVEYDEVLGENSSIFDELPAAPKSTPAVIGCCNRNADNMRCDCKRENELAPARELP